MQTTDCPAVADWWTIAGALSSVAAAVFAGAQIYLSRRDANRRAALEQLRLVDERLQTVLRTGGDVESARSDVLKRYRGETTTFTEGAIAFLALLNALEDTAHAVKNGIVDKAMAFDHLQTIIRPGVVPLTFISDLQSCCEDTNVYRAVRSMLSEVTKFSKKS